MVPQYVRYESIAEEITPGRITIRLKKSVIFPQNTVGLYIFLIFFFKRKKINYYIFFFFLERIKRNRANTSENA